MTMTRAEIEVLLDRLEDCVAEDLEGQHIDFKEWRGGGSREQLQRVVRAAVCMANGGGGTVVFGVADGVAGRARAVVGVPYHVNTGPLGAQVYDGTDPRLTPVFEEIEVPEGTRRLIVMHVHPGIPPYTDAAGRGAVRVGRDCLPLTGSLRRALNEESAGSDYTAETVEAPLSSVLSGAATEALRDAAKRERASEALIARDDKDLLVAIGSADEGRPTRAAVLLARSSAAMRRHVPRCLWTYVRMTSDTDYSERADGSDAIPLAVSGMIARIMSHNPIETVSEDVYDFEQRRSLAPAGRGRRAGGPGRVGAPRTQGHAPLRGERRSALGEPGRTKDHRSRPPPGQASHRGAQDPGSRHPQRKRTWRSQGGWVGRLRALPRIVRWGMRLEMRFAHYLRIYDLKRMGNATEMRGGRLLDTAFCARFPHHIARAAEVGTG